MSIPTVYVRAKSKKHANELLLSGDLMCTQYTPSGSTSEYLRAMPDGTVVKIWDKMAGSTPIAKSYGNWDSKKKRIK